MNISTPKSNIFAGAMSSAREWLGRVLLGTTAANGITLQDKLDQLYGGRYSAAGAIVNARTALSLSAAFACTRVLMEDIAALPLITYRDVDDVPARAKDHYLYNLLHDEPNPEMSAYRFTQLLIASMCLYGRGCAEIQRRQNGDVFALWPIPGKFVTPRRADDGSLRYRVQLVDPKPNEPQYTEFAADEMLYIPSLCFDSIDGETPISVAANVFGISLAMEQTASSHFKEGGLVKDIVSLPEKIDKTAFDNLKREWREQHGAYQKEQRTAWFMAGMKYDVVMNDFARILPPDIRKAQTVEICRLYRMPPHKIMELGEQKWANIEQMSREYLIGTLLPWFANIEQEMKRSLRRRDRNGSIIARDRDIYFEFLAEGILRGDFESRMRGYQLGILNGIYCPNECRRFENLPPYSGGDEYLRPGNTLSRTDPPPAAPR